MPIIIPSSNIYNYNVNKIKNNIIDRISYNKTNYVAKKEKKRVGPLSYDYPIPVITDNMQYIDTDAVNVPNTSSVALLAVAFINIKYKNYTISIPYNEYSADFAPTISPKDVGFDVKYKEYKRQRSGNSRCGIYASWSDNNLRVSRLFDAEGWTQYTETGNTISGFPSISSQLEYGDNFLTASAELSVKKNYTVSIEDRGDGTRIYISNVSVPTEFDTVVIYGRPVTSIGSGGTLFTTDEDVPLNTGIENPQYLESYHYVITQNSSGYDEVSFNIEAETHYFENEPIRTDIPNDTNKNVYSIDDNELIQDKWENRFSLIADGINDNPQYYYAYSNVFKAIGSVSYNTTTHELTFSNVFGSSGTVQSGESYTVIPYAVRAVLKEILHSSTDTEYSFPARVSGNDVIVTFDSNDYYNADARYYSYDCYVYITSNAKDNFFSDVINEYENGKETATLKCDIKDYFDGAGNKVISSDNSTGQMVFDIYDEVIPMRRNASGVDVPMSYYRDGTPKVFKVLGSKVYYDGAVWQEISLQEV